MHNRDALDAELVRQTQLNDGAAYDELFHHYYTGLCTYLGRLVGDDHTGCDLAQETFIKAWQAIPRLKGEIKFKNWLYSIATNLARDYFRHKRLIQWLPWEEHTEFKRDEYLVVSDIQIDERDALISALKQIPFKYRQCVLLQLVEGYKQSEIAEILGINEKSVSIYVRRGMEQLRHIYFSQVR